jgi:ABC-type sulfate transport system, permease component
MSRTLSPAQKAQALAIRGLALTYISFMLLLPLGGLIWHASQRPVAEVLPLISDPVAIETYKLTFGSAIASAVINTIFGGILAWILTRYQFWGKRLVDGFGGFALRHACGGGRNFLWYRSIPQKERSGSFSRLNLGWISGWRRWESMS